MPDVWYKAKRKWERPTGASDLHLHVIIRHHCLRVAGEFLVLPGGLYSWFSSLTNDTVVPLGAWSHLQLVPVC